MLNKRTNRRPQHLQHSICLIKEQIESSINEQIK